MQRTALHFALVGITLSALAATARGQASFQLPPMSNNAALQYWQAIAVMPALDESQEKMLDNWATVQLGAATSKLLDQSQTSMMYLRRAGAMTECDWGLDYSEGISMHLPHLAKGRTLARLAMLNARRAMAAGDNGVAGNEMGAVMALARNMGRDYTLVSMLVCYAVEGMVIDTVAPHVPDLGIPHADAIAAFGQLPPSPNLQHSVMCEKRLAASIIAQLQEAERNKPGSWREVWNAMLGPDTPDPFKDVQSLDVIVKAANDFQSVYDELAELVALPPAEFDVEFPKFVERAQKANPIAGMLLPAMNKVIATQRRSEVRMAMLLASFAVVEGGPEKLADIKDPFGDGPFEYRKLDQGFELTSKLMEDGKPVTLRIGQLD